MVELVKLAVLSVDEMVDADVLNSVSTVVVSSVNARYENIFCK